jgi:septin family protein
MLYFFGNSSHTNACDFTLLQEFQKVVNIIPVVSMADSFKPNELHRLKLDILNTAIDRRVQFFNCVGALDQVTNDVRSPNDRLLFYRILRNSKN